jgi:AraC-like DNA-binding protein
VRFSVGDGITWDVVRPERIRVAGLDMAGFRDRGTIVDLRTIPHPAVTLGLVFGAGRIAVDDGTGQRPADGLVYGLGLGYGAVRVWGTEMSCLQVRLSPAVARAVLGVSLAELDGTTLALDDLWGRDAARIREQLEDATSWDERFALTEAVIARRCARGPSVDPEVAWAWDEMIAGDGMVRVDGLADEVGWSRKRLWSRFRAQIGMPPKRAAQLVRFDLAAHRLVAGHDVARVAADGGYTDQSHLHREVVSFTGVTPTTVAREPFLLVDHLAWPNHTFVNLSAVRRVRL